MQPMMEYPIAMQEVGMRKGPWLEEEDERLTTFVTLLGERKWDSLAKTSGLKRSGKSCRLRWLNYLRPNLKHGPFSAEEEITIIQLQKQWGNKWSRIARRLPGRTDNEIKNYWRTHLRKKTESEQEDGSQWNLDWEGQGFYDQKRFIHVENCNKVPDRSNNDLDKSNDSLYSSNSWDLRRSPYETRMSDWIGSLHSSVPCEAESSEFNSMESYECFTPWTADNNNIWDYSDVLWDMKY